MKTLVLGVLLVGCGGGGSGGGPIPIDNLASEISQASCSKIFECCNSAEVMQQFMNITYNGQPVTTEMQCEGLTNGLFAQYLIPEYKASIAAGRITYDGSAARGCIDAFVNLGCGPYSQLSGAMSVSCDTPFIRPAVGDGGACSQSYECTGDFCDGATSSADGTCKPKPTAGQSCTGTCAPGLYCSGTCQPLLANGASCTGSEQCASGNCAGSTCADRAPRCDGP